MNHRFVATMFLIACHGGVKPHRPGEEFLEAIHLEGNQNIDDATIIGGLGLHRAEVAHHAVDPYLVSLDSDRIKGLYYRRGFLDIAVAAKTERHGDAATVTFKITEGPRAATKVAISGLPADVPVERIRALIHLEDGAPFEYAAVIGLDAIALDVVQNAGYAHAKVEGQLLADRETHQVTIDLAFTPGDKCVFGELTFNGLDDGLRDAVMARITIHKGDQYSNFAVLQTRAAIYGLQRFSTVRVEPTPDATNVVPVSVSLSEGANHEVKLGGGFGLDPVTMEIRGRAGYEIKGFPFAMDTLNLELRPAYALLRTGESYEPRIRAIARLERQDFLMLGAKGYLEGGYDYLTVEAYTSYGPRAALGFVAPLGNYHLQLRVGWAIEGIQFRDVEPLIDEPRAHALGIDHFERVGAFNQGLIVDYRDNHVEPTSGVYAELRAAEGGSYAAGAYAYEKIDPEVRGYIPVGPVVLAAKAQLGMIFGDVPPTERYFSGGASSQRGFSERQLSPFVAGVVNGAYRSIPFGGAAMAETGAEVRFPISHIRKMPLNGVVFVDGGDVTDTTSELDFGHMNWAAGVGLRLLTIIGPARLDLGYRLNRTGPLDPEPYSKFAIHISLGEAF